MAHDLLDAFVDRTRELELFRALLANKSKKRILLVSAPGEQGKTFLMLRLLLECEAQRPPTPVVLLDFDRRRSGLSDVFSVIGEVRRCLGDAATPAICACQDDIHRYALVHVQTGAGEGGVDLGRRNDYSAADVSDIAGRDAVNVSLSNVTLALPAPSAGQAGRALRSDLARLLGDHQRVVLLLDTFEHADSDVCAWLARWLFEPLRRELAGLRLVVAGRPECRAFFGQNHVWRGLVAEMPPFTPLSDADILAHYRQRELIFSESDIPLLLDLARLGPARMAEVGNWLAESRGGGQ